KVGAKERYTQNRIVKLFEGHLGYKYLGDWKDRYNENIESDLLRLYLQKQEYSEILIKRALRELDKAATLGAGRKLYDANKDVYRLLRYGIKVKEGTGEQNQTVWLIDWNNPEKNHFAIAEEVTVFGNQTKRPDIVLYLNGIAIGVIELKRSTIGLTEGIRQNLLNQRKDYIPQFFTTMQLVMAGNDTQGLRYGTIETKEKYYLEWKEDGGIGAYQLDRHLSLMCEKSRLLELIHDFIVFDAGVKKTCRPNQYFGVIEAQDYIKRHQGGIIWHTQGSGKSLTMAWLAKWIREKVKKDSRVLIITDRTELEDQIEKVFSGIDEDIYRTKSGADLIDTLNGTDQWLICSLVHKFGSSESNELSDDNVNKFMEELQNSMKLNFEAKGDIYVFVDECHRSHSGKFHSVMKKILPNALFIGFTGTPLLKKDKKTSLEVFGSYIHTYKFDEAIKDGIVLDLLYEPRDIDQNLTSSERVDLWFETKTSGLNDYARAQLKKKWGTMQKVLSSQSRLEMIVKDILLDMETRERLIDGRGNAILVSDSIYQACKFYDIFSNTELSDKCAIVTSYKPMLQDIKDEESGEGDTDKHRQYNIYRKMLASFFEESEDLAIDRVDEFEKKVKEKFVNEPGQMRLLIVVDKLLTGFDAPSATYLYIDKKMQDHGLFQAVCRVNRLDDGKQYGYIVDYKDLFNSLESSIKDYTSGAFDNFEKGDVDGLLTERLTKAKQRLDEAREAVKALCENVDPPKDTAAYIRYFCAYDTSDKEALKVNEPRRIELYKKTGSFIRAYAALANEMIEAGYSSDKIKTIKREVKLYENVQIEVKMASGDYIDLKLYEPSMRHLIDSYIRAEESQILSAFDDISLIQLIANTGEEAIDKLPLGIRNNEAVVAETIENNIRKVIIDEQQVNPKYYEKMSKLLDALIQERKAKALQYKDYLKKIIDLSVEISRPESNRPYPESLNTAAKRALYDNLGKDENLALRIDKVVKTTKKADFRGNRLKEREIELAIRELLNESNFDSKQIFELVKNQSEY
ncbi:MAG: HsdR family type I site-specific deoxyribonuclease, partial [Paracoccaceae bacterium]|nr:HsdR family type I site-specific deoxyribonuclease [Paracoccaceae bacterium]